jgi:hypothetical protein
MSFDNFITIITGILLVGIILGIFLRNLWQKLIRSRLYYLLTPKLIKQYVEEKK